MLFPAACEVRQANAPTELPASLEGVWTAQHINDLPLPALAYEFPLDETGGPGRSRFLLDSATMEFKADDKYTRILHYSEFQNPDPVLGAPWTLVARFQFGDHGFRARTGDAIMLESEFYQNLTASGIVRADGSVVMHHGLGHGDPPLAIGFRRR